MEDDRIMNPGIEGNEEERLEKSLRPQNLDEYIGQNKVKENMKIYIESAKKRNEPLDHCLLYGPPGLGKTTLANIIANEMKSNIKITSGPAIEKPGDLAALLTNLSEFDVLFIDEIHRLSKNVEEILYPALEDFTLDIVIGKGPSSRSIRLDLPKFTLIGATTKAGSLTTPLRDRFGIIHRLEIDELGLDEIDRKILEVMIEKYGGRPIGIDTLATTVGEEVDTIEDVYEPYLIQIGFISRTPRGRIPLKQAYEHMGIPFTQE